jgi:hypothetical protein
VQRTDDLDPFTGIQHLIDITHHYCVFRPNPATHSDLKRPPILVQTGHSFRFKPATDSG